MKNASALFFRLLFSVLVWTSSVFADYSNTVEEKQLFNFTCGLAISSYLICMQNLANELDLYGWQMSEEDFWGVCNVEVHEIYEEETEGFRAKLDNLFSKMDSATTELSKCYNENKTNQEIVKCDRNVFIKIYEQECFFDIPPDGFILA